MADPNRVQVTVCPVTVNNNSVTPATCRVLVTPLSSFQPPVSSLPRNNPVPPVNVAVVNKVMLKAVSRDKKKNHLKCFSYEISTQKKC